MYLGPLSMCLPVPMALMSRSEYFGFSDGLAYSFTGKMSSADAMDVECCGLYWHFVDVVWILIFPVVYLMEYAF